MKLLVLGGGGFLGHHVLTAACEAGHRVSTFTRSPFDTPDGVEQLFGDRRGDLTALAGQEWDAVLDTFTDAEPDTPAIRATADLLRDRVGMYGYVSGMSVYAPDGPAVPDESAPVRREGGATDRLQERSIAKLNAEQLIVDRFPGRAFFPRVGIMVGPRGRRFTYWPVRIAGAVEGRLPRTVLVPGDLDRQVQYSDARDIAGWVVTMLAAGRGGTFNTVGPGRPDTLRTVLQACLRAAGGSPTEVDWVIGDENTLRRRLTGIDEEQRPLWFPEDQIPQEAIDSTAALSAGLTFRSAEQTALDTLRWAETVGDTGLTDGAYRALEPQLIKLFRSG